ncbi:hypothetical protein Lfu02_59130 [Longispora fulva]|uniref:DNA-binding MarR family transcriptional regulator n=1 Tax=Longispora fulva TaxID=619741 RepID=A0A8J7GIA6_9ACTN|nr:MarR family winged helix-turn-helix transcriptional regulator [Longispora fulva]MBG6137105.1 DNA-binding MarR family transcriptional regulator [Longispora fulva]GIG61541.1 hypothetical protein Lfu02_59130 [Longispora fulva]
MSVTHTLNGQVIGRTALAVFAVRDRLLGRAGITFHQATALFAVATAGGSTDRAGLLAQLTGSLQIDGPTAETVLAELADAGLVELSESLVTNTAAGGTLNAAVRAELDELTESLYGDLPAEERATAGRLLATVTARANAVLAAA